MTVSNQFKIGILGAIVSLIALYFVVSQLDLELFLQAWQTANYWYIIPCVLFLLLGLITRAFRWRILLDNQLPFMRTFSIMNVAYLVNGVLPLRMGEVARVFLVSRTKSAIPIPTTTSTIIVERILDLLAVVLVVLLALMMGAVTEQIRTASGIATIFAIIGFIILIFLASRREWALNLFVKILKLIPVLNRYTVLEKWAEQFLIGLIPLTKPRALFLAFTWTAISWGISVLAGYVLMFAFFEQGDLPATMLYIAAVGFAVALPAVPGNLGPYEASILVALTAMGYEQSNTVIAFAVMVHAVNIFVHAVTGIIGFIQEGISLNQLSQGVQEMQNTTTEVG
ncbi:MAG: lysylphosphatidylglycerol synthase transmembrane domain-containing protein [Phototrophicaceae bacterium]